MIRRRWTKEGKPAWDWRCTTKPGKLYVLLEWPGATFALPGVKTAVTGAHLPADPAAPLTMAQTDGNVTVTLSARAPDVVASVPVLDVK